jgi:hypothetical protein
VVIEISRPAFLRPANDVALSLIVFELDQQRELIGDTQIAFDLKRGPCLRLVADDAIDRASSEGNRAALERFLSETDALLVHVGRTISRHPLMHRQCLSTQRPPRTAGAYPRNTRAISEFVQPCRRMKRPFLFPIGKTLGGSLVKADRGAVEVT